MTVITLAMGDESKKILNKMMVEGDFVDEAALITKALCYLEWRQRCNKEGWELYVKHKDRGNYVKVSQ